MLLKIKITPNSPKNEIIEHTKNYMRIRIKAAPEKGKANKELLKFLSKHFSVPTSSIILKGGKNSPKKIIEIKNYFV